MPPIIISSEYLDLAKVFSEKVANILTGHGLQNLVLQTLEISLFGPPYNLSKVEFEIL